jgi:ribosomal protein L11 methyltransferase
VPLARLEEARARMLELFPEGFQEIDRADGVELVAYTDPGGEERVWFAFSAARASDVAPRWEERWRDFHRPVVVEGVWIGPPWEEPPSALPSVVIDPGRAFGTGAHATTRLSLQLLARLERGSVLDIGCGSGVLAIAAAKLGFGPVSAIDVDAQAVAAARLNARVNGVTLSARVADATRDELPATDVAVANVTRDLVEAVAPRLDVARLVTSGYLESGPPPSLVGFTHVDRETEGGWAADTYAREAQ